MDNHNGGEKEIVSIETHLMEKRTFKDGSHEHRIHYHTQHKVAIFFKIQLPDELIPRHIQLNLCPVCGLAWWMERQGGQNG